MEFLEFTKGKQTNKQTQSIISLICGNTNCKLGNHNFYFKSLLSSNALYSASHRSTYSSMRTSCLTASPLCTN